MQGPYPRCRALTPDTSTYPQCKALTFDAWPLVSMCALVYMRVHNLNAGLLLSMRVPYSQCGALTFGAGPLLSMQGPYSWYGPLLSMRAGPYSKCGPLLSMQDPTLTRHAGPYSQCRALIPVWNSYSRCGPLLQGILLLAVDALCIAVRVSPPRLVDQQVIALRVAGAGIIWGKTEAGFVFWFEFDSPAY